MALENNKRYNYSHLTKNNLGVTLIELMIAVAISGFVVAAIYMSFKAQQRAATSQNKVAEIQQTIRASLYLMSTEIRMAGYNPDLITMNKIKDANNTKITFKLWDNTNDEIDLISYRLDSSNNTLDRWLDHNDNSTASYQTVAENIETVDFYYTMKDSTKTYNPIPLTDIRSLTISIIARSNIKDPNYTNNNTYYSANGTIINYGDGFRRRQLITTVKCRNMGLN